MSLSESFRSCSLTAIVLFSVLVLYTKLNQRGQTTVYLFFLTQLMPAKFFCCQISLHFSS